MKKSVMKLVYDFDLLAPENSR